MAHSKVKSSVGVLVLVAAQVLVLGANVRAEEATASIELEGITVTAQKRDQKLQDVALTVGALGSDALQDRPGEELDLRDVPQFLRE